MILILIYLEKINLLEVSPKISQNLRRSIYVIKNIKKGEKFTKNIKTLRPALGIEAKFFENYSIKNLKILDTGK